MAKSMNYKSNTNKNKLNDTHTFKNEKITEIKEESKKLDSSKIKQKSLTKIIKSKYQSVKSLNLISNSLEKHPDKNKSHYKNQNTENLFSGN